MECQEHLSFSTKWLKLKIYKCRIKLKDPKGL